MRQLAANPRAASPTLRGPMQSPASMTREFFRSSLISLRCGTEPKAQRNQPAVPLFSISGLQTTCPESSFSNSRPVRVPYLLSPIPQAVFGGKCIHILATCQGSNNDPVALPGKVKSCFTPTTAANDNFPVGKPCN